MTTAHVSRTTANGHGAWGAVAMVAALLVSVLLLVVTGLDRSTEATPMPFPRAPTVAVDGAGAEGVAEPMPAPAPQSGPIR